LARGGSKGIPNKNMVLLKNKPMIKYVLDSSLNSMVDETWVCSDSIDILNFSNTLGAKVLLRPKELATDTSPSEDSLLFFCKNVNFDVLVFIQPTSPLLKSKYINEGVLKIKNKEYDSVFSVSEEHWIPRWTKELTPINWDVKNRPRRQDMDVCYIENGAFYITKKKNLLHSKLRYSGKKGFVIMPYSESFQVDSYDDLAIIEKLI